MAHKLSQHEGPDVEFSDQEFNRLDHIKFKVREVRAKWYLGVPSVLMNIAEDLADIPPNAEIIDAGLFDE